MSEGTGGAEAQRPRHPRFELADGVRGIACFAMVVIHVAVFTLTLGDGLIDRGLVRLDVAFTIFFVLSAFLLYRPMIAHRDGGPRRPGVASYGVRRFLRIYPAYWVALTALAIYPGLLAVSGSNFLGAYTLAGNLDPPYANGECGGEIFRCGLPQTWSLTVEITFYLLLPAFAWLTDRMARGRAPRQWIRRELALIAAIGILSAALSIAPFDFRDDFWFRYSLLGNMLWIGLGLALAVASVAWHRAPRPRALQWFIDRPLVCWGMGGAIWVALLVTLPAAPYIVARETDLEFIVSYVAFALVALLVMIPVVFVGDGLGAPRRLLALRPVAWYGSIAFGVFLWQVTIAYNLGFGAIEAGFWTTLILTFLISTPIATASYYLIERPLMAPRSPFWRRRRRPTG